MADLACGCEAPQPRAVSDTGRTVYVARCPAQRAFAVFEADESGVAASATVLTVLE
jgi:hypothetical protein